MAGDSARDVARRQREKAARLERSAEAWERGAEGEAATAAALHALNRNVWRTFHDVRWPGRQRANIDHVVVGPGGVFVIDSKHWSGDIRVAGDVLYQGSRRREREVAAAADAALAVTQFLQGLPATPVLCFVRPEPMDAWARDVMICSTQNLAEKLVAQPPMLGPESIRRVITILERQLSSAMQPTPARSARRRPPSPGPRPASARKIVLRLTAVAIGLLATLIGVGLVLGVLGSIGRAMQAAPSGSPSGAQGTSASSAPVLGDVASLPATSSHPALRLKADKVMRVDMTEPAATILRGEHLVAVRYSIRNGGTQLWGAAPPHLQFSALTSDGQRAQPGRNSVLSPRELLPAAFNLGPGKQRRGYVVFLVPDGSKLVRVSVQMSFDSADGAEWLIP